MYHLYAGLVLHIPHPYITASLVSIISRGYFVSGLRILRQRFRGVEYVMLIQYTEDSSGDSSGLNLFPYFFEQP